MASAQGHGQVEALHVSDDSDADENSQSASLTSKPQPTQRNARVGNDETQHDKLAARQAALQRELESVRRVNESIEESIESLGNARSSMKTVHSTVSSASSLLATWTKILSQTEHNQRLILSPSWQGASQDLADAEGQARLKQQAAQRRAYDEQERRLAAARKADEESRRRSEAGTRAPRGSSRSRGGTSDRGGDLHPVSGPFFAGLTKQGGQGGRGAARGSSSVRRTTSGVGRGIGSVRGRGRG